MFLPQPASQLLRKSSSAPFLAVNAGIIGGIRLIQHGVTQRFISLSVTKEAVA
jgi:hypothetical protein